MKALLSMIAAAAMAGTFALPVAAQAIDDYGAMTCTTWNALDAAGKLQAAQGLRVFVKESANHDVAGAATGLLDDKTQEQTVQMIDNGCTNAAPDVKLIAALVAN